MGKIVCAIRGGESSRRAQERALELGKERKEPVAFVHIIDTDLVQRMETPIADAVFQEMERIGESLLSIAAERAEAYGVQADAVMLRGTVRQTLETFLRDSQATLVVMGSPNGDPVHNTFNAAQFEQFVAHLQNDLGIEVQVV